MVAKKLSTIFIIILISNLFFNFKTIQSNKTASVKFVIGKADVQSKGRTSWRTLKLNSEIVEGDRIKTTLNSRVEIDMPDGTVLKINQNTIFDITEIKDPIEDNEDKMSFTLWAGNLWAKFKKIVSSRQERTIESPSAVVAIRGTTLEMDVDLNQKTVVRVTEGLVSVKSKDAEGEVEVGSNQETTVEKGQPPTEPKTTGTEETGTTPKGSDDEFIFEVNLQSFVFTDPAVLVSGIPVSGRLSPGTLLYANDNPVPVNPNGIINARIRVIEGLNNILLTAQKNGEKKNRSLKVYVNTKKPEIRLSSPLVSGFYNRRNYSLSGGIFDLTPGDKIKIMINNDEVAEVPGQGSFNRTIILNEGQNSIQVVARDRSGNTTELSQQLFLDTVKPILTITEPAEQVAFRLEPPAPPTSTVSRIEQDIRGIVIDPEPSSGIKRIAVNGKDIQPNSDGSFETKIFLQRGENRLNFYVEDLAGNIIRDNTRVIRVPR